MFIRRTLWHGNSTAIVIPADIVNKLGITRKMSFYISEEDGIIKMKPLTDDSIDEVFTKVRSNKKGIHYPKRKA